MKVLTLLSCVVVASARVLRTGSSQQGLAAVHETLDIDIDLDNHVGKFIAPTIGQDENHGFCFKMGFDFTHASVVKKQEEESAKEDGTALDKFGADASRFTTGTSSAPSKSMIVEAGVSLEPGRLGPFFSFTYNFPKSFGQMFQKIAAVIKELMVKLKVSPANQAKIVKTKDVLKNFAATYSSLKADVKEKMKKYKVLNWILEHGYAGVNTGNRGNNGAADGNSNHGNDGWLFDFKFADSGNDGNPSLQLEWRLKDSNELTSCCVDLVNPLSLGIPTIAPGTCGWSNQGLHAQAQVGGINWLTALLSAALPLGKTIDSYAKKDKAGKLIKKAIGTGKFATQITDFDTAAMKTDIQARFKALKDEGGSGAAAVATLINGVANAALTALKQATFTTTLEIRAAIFTAGFSGQFKIADILTAIVAKKGKE